MGGVVVAHKILETAQSPNSSFHFLFDCGLGLGTWSRACQNGFFSSKLLVNCEQSLQDRAKTPNKVITSLLTNNVRQTVNHLLFCILPREQTKIKVKRNCSNSLHFCFEDLGPLFIKCKKYKHLLFSGQTIKVLIRIVVFQ